MSHNLMERNGTVAMFCVGERDAAWHKLGQRTPNAVTWAEAIKLSDLDWEVVKKQLYARNPKGEVTSLPYWGTFRTDDGAFLNGIVGEGYTVMQNKDAFNTCDSLITASNGAHYESAGAKGSRLRVAPRRVRLSIGPVLRVPRAGDMGGTQAGEQN